MYYKKNYKFHGETCGIDWNAWTWRAHTANQTDYSSNKSPAINIQSSQVLMECGACLVLTISLHSLLISLKTEIIYPVKTYGCLT